MKVLVIKYQGPKSTEAEDELYNRIKEKIEKYGFILAPRETEFETVEMDGLGKPQPKKKFYDNMAFPEMPPAPPKPPGV